MARPYWFLFVVGLLAPSFCLADGINVNVNGSINATGTVGYVCGAGLPCIGDVIVESSLTLTGTNTTGSLSKSGTASAVEATLSMEVDQSVTVASSFDGDPGDLIQIALSNFETPGGALGGGAGTLTSFWSTSVNNDVSATFTIASGTTASLTFGSNNSPGFSPELLDSAGNPVFKPNNGISGGSFVYLKPGTYQLVDDFTGELSGFGFDNPTGVQTDTLYFFIPGVPEPQWSSAILVLLVALGSFAYRRRTGRTTSS